MSGRAWQCFLGGALAVSLVAHAVRGATGDRVRGVELAPEQQAELGSCCGDLCCEDEVLAAERQRLLGELVAALRAPDWDEAKVRAVGDQFAELQKRATQHCVESAIAVRGVLTPEQLEQLAACCPPENQ